ncbi:MAG: GNAT family N-acetyltransferase [Desulfobacterales bacterium]
MPRLYLDEYRQALAGRHVSIACREGILRDHFSHILADIKFLSRQGIRTTLYHNMANRFANQKHFRLLEERLPETTVERVPMEADFYTHVLGREQRVFKLIFLERKYLCDPKGHRINTLTTRDAVEHMGELLGNVNLAGVLAQICARIDEGAYERVHILPARKDSIKHELFTIEGTGTLIANNFREEFLPVVTDADVQMVAGILELYKREGFLRPRSREYLSRHRQRFFITRIDGIAVGCVECKPVDDETVELGALAISARFRNQRVGVFMVEAFTDEARRRGCRRIISLTNNPRLQGLYLRMGFERRSPAEFSRRQAQSPGVAMFVRSLH